MRTPHIPTHQADQSDGPPTRMVPPGRNPYDELASLADHSLDDFLTEDSAATRQDDDAEEPWAPPNHRRGSRRRNRATGLPTLVRFLVWALTFACLVTLADRWALLYAEHKASQQLKDKLHLAAAPEVHIGGFPFLTQLAARRLDSVRITVPDIPAHRVTLTEVTATADDIRIDGDGPTTVRGALVRQAHGQVLLSFADMNRELGASQLAFTAEGPGTIRAHGTLHIAGRDLSVRADARVRLDGERGIATSVDGIRLDIDDLATYQPGTRPTEGLHLTSATARRLTREAEKIKALLALPAIVHRLGVPDSAVSAALHDEDKLHQLTGAPRFLHDLTSINLVDVALAHPWVLEKLGLDPSLLPALTKLTRPQIADRFSFAFQLPKPPSGALRLERVTVGKDGIRADVSGAGLLLGH
ncbi:LmeA family phospholipid-binding protein [Streptomyces sp. FXJ1.172]|uniref:LmeA family phospholipid-binding protein n=1 Tax=Streptomyces sp. FXJ1.172 TaxID=710705 RepID=UPI0007CFE267